MGAILKMTDFQEYFDSIAYVLRDMRKKRKLTYKLMSKKTGFSTPYLCDIENRRREPTLKIIIAYAEVFDVSLQYIICKAEILKG